jgi:glycosyltransferase involved in cell wall biosynthesis
LSTLEPRKNLVTSIKAFARVVEALPEQDVRFVVAGVDGWGDQISVLNALPANVTSRIAVTGYVADEVVPALIADALCLVYPSLYEGFGLPVLEAMTCGVPAIVSNRGSLPEIVGAAGVIVDPFDDQAIAQTIVGWARSDDDRRRLADLGRAQATKFSWDVSVAKIIQIMREREAGRAPD